MGFSRQGYWNGLPFPSPKKRESRYKRYVLCGCILRKVGGEITHWFLKSDVGEGMGSLGAGKSILELVTQVFTCDN